LSLLFFLVSCSQKPQKKVYFKMDTVLEITLYSNKNTNEIFEKTESFLENWDKKFSPGVLGSEILRVNNREKDTLEICDDLFEMLEVSLKYSQKTDGLFDITLKPLKDFWDINAETAFLPDPQDSSILDTLVQILSDIDYKKITLLDNPRRVVFENPKTQIDLGAVAKGFAIDKLADTLKFYGFTNFIINVGGDVYVSGNKGFARPIVVGIRDPRDRTRLLKTLKMNGAALMTSGDYERFRIAESGARVHHIFDLRTGFSASKNISLTIIGERATVADILATGLFALSAEEITEKIKEFEGYEFIVTDSLENVFSSLNQ
jgi:thiamine biosynthesis lipoprotein